MMSPERFRHYLTGNKEADEVHFVLLGMADDLMIALKHWKQDCCHDGKCSKAVNFLNALQEHINAEEIEMERVEYPYRLYHNQSHDTLLHKIKSAIAHYKENPIGALYLANQIYDVSELYIKHLEDYDLQFYNWHKQEEDLHHA